MATSVRVGCINKTNRQDPQARHSGREYLKTEADGVKPDNLLSLSECPS
jgi:hypothetical protein